ncbi:MAG TPA: hypothetical protein VKB03_01815 [Conexibacter sp.]|nr:hypothetical protein [Conexibacter sp.]
MERPDLTRRALAEGLAASAGKCYVDWDLPDPKGQPLDAVRAMRDEIAERVGALVAELDAS